MTVHAVVQARLFVKNEDGDLIRGFVSRHPLADRLWVGDRLIASMSISAPDLPGLVWRLSQIRAEPAVGALHVTVGGVTRRVWPKSLRRWARSRRF